MTNCREKYGEPSEANVAKWCNDCWRVFKGYGYLEDENGQHSDEGMMRWCKLCGADCSFVLYDKEGNKM